MIAFSLLKPFNPVYMRPASTFDLSNRYTLAPFLILLLMLALPAEALRAGGYQVNLFGQRQIGMGHAGAGLPLDYAIIAQNPAGLAALRGNGVILGASATYLTTDFRTSPEQLPTLNSNYETSTQSNARLPFGLYAGVDTPVDKLKVGLGIYTPYGNNVEWEEDWLYSGLLTKISLSATYIQPTVSYEISDRLSVGAGLIYAVGLVNLQRRAEVDLSSAGASDSIPLNVELDGSTTAFGYNVGLFYEANRMLSLGVSYRSEVEMEVEGGDAFFELEGNVPAPVENSLFPEGNRFDASLPLPGVLSVGLGIRPNKQLRFALDANLTFWSTYEELSFDFEENTQAVTDSEDPREFNDAWVIRAGGEWDATPKLQLRAGAYIDNSPVDEGYITPETPDVNRYGLSVGIGYEITRQFRVDASLLHITSSYREQSRQDATAEGTPDVVPIGEFRNTAWIPGVSLGYQF